MLNFVVNWAKASPKRAFVAAAIVVSGIGTATGIVPLQVVADTLNRLAPLLGT